MPVAIHSRLWRRLHGYQDSVMEAQAALLTDEVTEACAEIQYLQGELWRRFRTRLSRQAPGLVAEFDRLALIEAREDQEMYRALQGERECDGHLVFLNVAIDRHKSEVRFGDEAA